MGQAGQVGHGISTALSMKTRQYSSILIAYCINPLTFTQKGQRKKCVCVEVSWHSQLIRVMSSAVSLPNHTFSWASLVL